MTTINMIDNEFKNRLIRESETDTVIHALLMYARIDSPARSQRDRIRAKLIAERLSGKKYTCTVCFKRWDGHWCPDCKESML